MTCTRYALYVGPNGRKITQPLHTDAHPPESVTLRDGVTIPLVLIGTYEPEICEDR